MRFRAEGDHIGPGFNFYRLRDPDSFGFVWQGKKWIWRLRYSKRTKKWHGYFKRRGWQRMAEDLSEIEMLRNEDFPNRSLSRVKAFFDQMWRT